MLRLMEKYGILKVHRHIHLKKNLEKLGVKVELFNMWNNNAFKKTDIFHIFSSNFGIFDFVRYLNSEKKKFVVSPIFFTRSFVKIDYFLASFL